MYNNYYGKSKEEGLKQTEHEYFRDEARGQFRSRHSTSRNVEHKVEVKTVDDKAFDYFYKRQSFLRKVKHDTQTRNNTLRKLFRKRDFNKKELKRYKELDERIGQRIGLTYDEDMEFQYLDSIRFVQNKERGFRRAIDGIDKIYYYKDAQQRLKQSRRVEWNGDRTTSRESSWNQGVLNKNPSVSIVVNKENPIDHSQIAQKKRMNAVIVTTVSHLNPGGSWEKGEEGVEESLFYRSSYELSLDGDGVRDGLYPLEESAILYSPKVMIYKYGKNQLYKLTNQNNNLTLISSIGCCGFHTIEYKEGTLPPSPIKVKKTRPRRQLNKEIKSKEIKSKEVKSKEVKSKEVKSKEIKSKEIKSKEETEEKNIEALKVNKNLLSDKSVKIYKDKLHNIFQTALYWGHNALIMDPLGCMISSSETPPVKHCASIIREIIFDDETMYYKKFKYIAFCIGIREMSGVPKAMKSNDANSYIYSREHSEFLKEEKIYKVFHQTLHQVDKFSA